MLDFVGSVVAAKNVVQSPVGASDVTGAGGLKEGLGDMTVEVEGVNDGGHLGQDWIAGGAGVANFVAATVEGDAGVIAIPRDDAGHVDLVPRRSAGPSGHRRHSGR